MPKLSFLLILFFATPIALLSCAKEKSGEPPVATEHPIQVLNGTITENVKKVQAADFRESCDEKFRDGQLEVAAALDARNSEINRFVNAKPAEADIGTIRVQLGPITVREQSFSASPAPGWRSVTVSWEEIYSYFQKIKHAPVNDDWVALNRMVRGILSEDIDRAVQGINPYLDKDSAHGLELLSAAVGNCVTNPRCGSVKVPASLGNFLDGQPIYREYLKYIEERSGLAEQRKYLLRFRNYVASDFRRFGFRTNPRMDRVEPGKYELFVDAGPFEKVGARLAAYVENVWSGPSTQVRVRWKGPNDYPDLFRIIVGKGAGERSYVDQNEHKVVLFPDVIANSIAHELGHVMGFPDRYYMVWHPESCVYETQYSNEDIMSNSATGIVLPSHWEDLANHYH